MKVKRRDWKSYEQLAEAIYRKLEPGAVVKHDDAIHGHDSGTKRQIDVSIRKNVASHEVLVVVQVRDRKRAPTVNDVGEFASVIRDVRASKGVMVCRQPPGKNAARLALASGIEMCSAFDVNDREWDEDLAVPVIVTLVEGEMTPLLSFASGGKWNISLPPKPAPGFVSLDGGKTRTTLLDYMAGLVMSRGSLRPGTHHFRSPDRGLRILLNGKDWVPLPFFEVEVSFSIRKLFRYCRIHEYLALRNYTTDKLTIAELKVELPRFANTNAWQSKEDIEIPEVTQNVPIVDLRPSPRFTSQQFRLQLLPMEVLEEQREERSLTQGK